MTSRGFAASIKYLTKAGHNNYTPTSVNGLVIEYQIRHCIDKNTTASNSDKLWTQKLKK